MISPTRIGTVALPRIAPLVAACIALISTAAAAEPPRRPNVVVILSDDQGWGDLSVSGNRQLNTPHIDSLAHHGATLDRFYVCPVCSPTRAEFLTGRYHPRCGVSGVSTGQERLNLDERTIAESFRAAGYATGAFGKWHNGSQWPYHPNARGFQEYYGFTSGHWGEYFDPPLEHNGQLVRGKGFIADDFTSHAIAFIEENKDQPFFCYLPLNTPHSPYAVPDEFWQKHKDQPITQRGANGAKESIDETRCILAMCENIDWNVGRVLRRLDELKLTDNTIVIYFCDNGPHTVRWNGGMKGTKGSTDEGGVRSPCFVRWPGKITGGRTIREISGAIDLLPTLAKLVGIPVVGSKPLDGMDISPLLLGTASAWPDRMIFSHWHGKFSVRTQQYRQDSTSALFDMTADPGQTRNIAAEQPEVAARLSNAVAAWRKEMFPAKRVDDRPYPVGYVEFPVTPLPARDGVPHGEVKRSASAPNCSYFVNWRSTKDSITWDIDVHTAGDYAVTIYYTCPVADAGSTIELSFRGSKITGKVAPGWDPPLYTNQDTIRRPDMESQMKEFRPLDLGTVHLNAGRGLLALRALEIPGKSVMDMRLVMLKLKTAGEKSTKQVGPKPNVLFIAIDDQNDWIGALGGHPLAKTPNIDRLAARGTLFTNAHCQAPLCNPSRTSVMLSLRPSTSGVYGLAPWFRTVPAWRDRVTLAQHFHAHGYKTYVTGKIFHDVPNNSAERAGEFDDWGPGGSVGAKPSKKLIPPTPMGNVLAMDWGVFPHHDEDKGDYKVASWAVEQLRAAPRDRPFFLAAGFFLPHVPCYVTQQWFDLYPDDDSLLPPVQANDRADTPQFSWYLHWRLPEPRLKWVRDNNQWRNLCHSYLASTSFVDAQISRLFDALDAAKLTDNTLIVLWSDHGYHLGEQEITGKNTLWERSTRVPMIFAGPGVSGATRCTRSVELLDIYPTLIDLCGLSPRDDLEGISLLPQLKDAAAPRERPAITTQNQGNHAVRSERYRYIRYADGSEEFYDHQSDPNEWTNLAADARYAPVIADHRRWLPKTDVPPAPGSATRVLSYDKARDEATWEGKIIHRGDKIPE